MVKQRIVSDKLVHRVSVAHPVHQVQMVKLGPQVLLVHLVLLELTVLKVLLVPQAHLA